MKCAKARAALATAKGQWRAYEEQLMAAYVTEHNKFLQRRRETAAGAFQLRAL